MDGILGDCRIGWYSVPQPCFFVTIWFQRERYKALQSVAILGHVFFYDEVSCEELHESRDLWTGGSSPSGDEVLT
jgi:hypothetical protein